MKRQSVIRRFAVGFTCLFAGVLSHAQTTELDLDACHRAAAQNYPLVKQRELISKSVSYTIDNVNRGKLPQVVIAGQATHQSEVTEIPIRLPGVEVPAISKDQYRLYAELSQPITDIAVVNRQKEASEVAGRIQSQNLEVELYKLRDRINQLFFGALLIDEQLKQNELLKKDIQAGINRVRALVENGAEFKSSLDKLSAELLRAEQRTIELSASRKSFLVMLGMFMNTQLGETTSLKKPVAIAVTTGVNRPELTLFDFQKESFAVQNRLISIRNMPRLSLFIQGGAGRPNPMNMLSNEFSPYYIGGLRLNWSLSSFYTTGKERQLLVINHNLVESQKETFLFNTNLALGQQQAEISRLQQLIGSDEQIISLRTSIKESSSAQLQNGVITVNDFLREVNAEDQARQSKLLHETQLLLALYTYQATAGN